MGLFGSKKKTYVGTVAQRVIEDNAVPDSPKTGAIKGVLENGEIVEYVLDEVLGSVGLKADRLYEYAKKNYPVGLPTKTFQSRSQGSAQIAAILQGIHGKPVNLEYSKFGVPNLTHIAWMKLIANHGYDPTTNIIGSLSTANRKVYLDNILMLLPAATAANYESGALEQWGKSPASGTKSWEPYNQDIPQVVPTSPVMHVANLPDEKIRIQHGWSETKGLSGTTVTKGHFDIATTGYIDDAEYFHAKYTVDGKLYYWMYKKGTGTYPSLDNLFENNAKLGSFYPMTYLRYGKKPMNQNKTGQEYKSSKKMMKYLGLNYDQLIDMVHENPDVADVEQAILMFAIPANSTDQMEQRYLYNFFDQMYLAEGGMPPSSSPYGKFNTLAVNDVKNAVVIQDNKFKMALNTSGLQKFMKKGIVAKVGEYNSYFGVEKIDSSYLTESGAVQPTKVDVDYHAYQKQVSDNLYQEVRVYNLKTVFHVFGGYTTTGDDQSSILIIPLDKSIVDLFTVPEKERLISRSLHFVFNSVTVVKLKWYQTGLFKAFMIIAAIVITVFTYGSTWAAMGTALAAGGAAAVLAIQTILIGVLKAIVFSYGFKLFVQAVGPEFAMLLAIVTIAYGGYRFFGEGKSLFAENLLQVGNGLVKGTQTYYANAIEGLQNEYLEFTSLAQQMEKDLKDASDALMTSTTLSPFVVFGEKPNDFFNRTVHSGNIGVQSIAAVSNYFDIALQLPKLDDTV